MILKTAQAVGLATAVIATGAQAGDWVQKTDYLGYEDVWVYTPDTFTPKAAGKRGLVVSLIGCGQINEQLKDSGGWPDAAEAYGLVVMVPDPVYPAFPNSNAPKLECYDYNYGSERDHAIIIKATKDFVADPANNIDPNQVYVTGLSAGAAVAQEIACEAPDVFSGAALSAPPGLGSSQATAVYRDYLVSESSIKSECEKIAGSKKAQLSEQVYTIIADDNNIPFSDTNAYDGDKFVAVEYHPMTAGAMAQIFGATNLGEVVTVGTGTGLINYGADRDFEATAELWRDSEGLIRVSLITHDTLRHAWPSGPLDGDKDNACSIPEGENLDDYKDAQGNWDTNKLRNAPNGLLGCLYQNEYTMDFPMYLAKLFNENNPKLSKEPTNLPPEVSLEVYVDGNTITAMGSITDPEGNLQLGQVSLSSDVLNAPIVIEVGAGDFTRSFTDLEDGVYVVMVTGSDEIALTTQESQPVTIGDVEINTAPVITISGEQEVTVELNTFYIDAGATAYDAEDGDLTAAIVKDCNVDTSKEDTYTCTYTVTDSGMLTDTKVRTVIVKKGGTKVETCEEFTDYLYTHLSAGRVTREGWFFSVVYKAAGSGEKIDGYYWSQATVHQLAGDSNFYAGACPAN